MAAATSHKNIKNALSEIWMQTDVFTVSKTEIDDYSMVQQTSTHKILSSFLCTTTTVCAIIAEKKMRDPDLQRRLLVQKQIHQEIRGDLQRKGLSLP